MIFSRTQATCNERWNNVKTAARRRCRTTAILDLYIPCDKIINAL